MLNTITHGQPTDLPPLVIVHGLFGSARNWGVIAKRLADRRQVVAVDLRNHGASPWFDTHSYHDMADDLGRTLDGLGPVDLVWHSMGGKAAMVLALTRPERVNRLLVADIAPVPYGHTQMQYIDAMRRVDLARVERRADAAAQLADHGVDPALQSFFTQSLDLREKRWQLNLDALADHMPHILSFPDISGAYDAPTLFLSGGKSDYVQREHRPRIRELFPAARFARLPNAGHWLHAEEPRAFEASVRAFMGG